MRFAGAGSDDDRLHYLRSVLPCEVRVVGQTHPLFGQVLRASSFTRLNRVLHLVVGLPDGSPGTIRAAVTDVFGQAGQPEMTVAFDIEGLRELRALVLTMGAARVRRWPSGTQIGSPRP
jgi:hypothetical protein